MSKLESLESESERSSERGSLVVGGEKEIERRDRKQNKLRVNNVSSKNISFLFYFSHSSL